MNGFKSFAGTGLLIISGTAFSSAFICAVISLENGVDLNTSNAGRYAIAALFLFFYHKITNRPIKIGSSERYAAFALGITVFMVGFGYLSAIHYIPVSLAVLIFYTGPFFVFIIARFTEKEPFSVIRLTAFGLAFFGLYLAMEIETSGSLHITGILFALIAAIGVALFITIGNLTIRKANPQVVSLYTLSSGAVLFGLLLFKDNSLNELSASGLLFLTSSAFFQFIAYISFFAGLKLIGSIKASMLLNIEPITTIALSVVIFDETLSGIQYIGACLVITGIFLISYKPGRRTR